MQVAMYVLAAVLYSMSCAEEKQVSLFAAPVPPSEIPAADECVICLGSCEACEDAEVLKHNWRRLNCGHQFHEHCIFEWLKKAQQCPMCRRHICEKGIAKWKGASGGAWAPSESTSEAPSGVPSAESEEESEPLLNRMD